jgi:hypothetical protein
MEDVLKVVRIAPGAVGVDEADRLLVEETQYPISVLNWPDYGYAPEVSIALGYDEQSLHLRFHVQEQAVLAVNIEPNSPVCQDSCVELFISVDGIHYYNFEFNCIGTALVQYGSSREGRQPLEPGQIARIQRLASLGSSPFPERREMTTWSLSASIPLDILGLEGQALAGRTCRANAYKCGDHLTERHYVTWNPVESPHPDFHRPECFGGLVFE